MGKITPTPQSQQTKLSAPVPLTADHDLSEFDCGESALNDWLKQRALKNESRFSRTYVVCDGNRAVAYFCISAGAVERASAPGKVRRNADGSDETRYLEPIQSFVERGVTPADELLEKYHGPWHGSVEPAFEEQDSVVSKYQ